MKIAVGDLWTYPADLVMVPTCGTLRKDGRLVMGRGVALEAKERFPSIDFMLGKHVSIYGNIPVLVSPQGILTIPTKHQFWQDSDIELMESGLRLLLTYPIDTMKITLPSIGCGLGHLKIEDVLPLCQELLDDRFTMVLQKPVVIAGVLLGEEKN